MTVKGDRYDRAADEVLTLLSKPKGENVRERQQAILASWLERFEQQAIANKLRAGMQ